MNTDMKVLKKILVSQAQRYNKKCMFSIHMSSIGEWIS